MPGGTYFGVRWPEDGVEEGAPSRRDPKGLWRAILTGPENSGFGVWSRAESSFGTRGAGGEFAGMSRVLGAAWDRERVFAPPIASLWGL